MGIPYDLHVQATHIVDIRMKDTPLWINILLGKWEIEDVKTVPKRMKEQLP